MVFDEYTGKCTCGIGFKFSGIMNKCIRCLSYRGKCVEKCPHFYTKENEKESICEDRIFNFIDLSFLYWICGACILFTYAIG